ncbi:UDP-N-acetylmuramoyl-tripeptide--D-alanyl-D-alanine ligase [Rubrivivax gelatinosus]|uniref:UDP-N-acetylmuramoyl-tripeptide--D-alanyl-D-alanine ligase n=1 Tax=Rubrivivax gelatinosus (strain NBRC 100245 / IL144) TaxID=983917 RepID=I0HMQ4_RUBGI|nr:UDP-N-acetylmuramoyl-tripeptide--D-alanyl-D-alanine ligase [Rubrivivax gelatinosus]BAL94291.1 UDP-N-acetylmuramoyl-tripeptide--D-alanyl-D-alanine ligase MurF [Rubrivivax gelatinosus IL144]
MRLTLAQALPFVPGATLVGDGATKFSRVHSDTRTLRAGDLFVALRGERFDGHDFLASAREAGAVAAIAEHGLSDSMPGLLVPDALRALQQLAAGWRARFLLPLVAVTGSNGKTTVTQMVAAILRAAHGDAAFATRGNLNNHIGVPLTLLGLLPSHTAGVVELGMNHPGEIAELAAIARPTIALVNNAQREHQEFMATVEAVARENGQAIAMLPPDGVAVFPADDEYTPLWRQLAGARRTISFALDGAADLTARAEWQGERWQVEMATPAGALTTTLAVAGLHNVKNALAAAACALAAGVKPAAIAAGLAAFQPVAGRSQAARVATAQGEITLVDDSYNANPDSVLAAVAVLAALPGPRWLVLGDMGEVGERGPEFHAEVGAAARAAGIETVWTAGTLSRHVGAQRHFNDAAAMVAALADAPQAASVLVKGSRFMRMEQVVRVLKEGVR